MSSNRRRGTVTNKLILPPSRTPLVKIGVKDTGLGLGLNNNYCYSNVVGIKSNYNYYTLLLKPKPKPCQGTRVLHMWNVGRYHLQTSGRPREKIVGMRFLVVPTVRTVTWSRHAPELDYDRHNGDDHHP